MVSIIGRSIGPWGVLTVLAGAAVMIPSAIALLLTLVAVVAAVI